MKILGIEKHYNVTMFELFLLMTIFLHRAVLKKFGLWKSSKDTEFEEGSYHLESCDTKTIEMLQHCKPSEENDDEDSYEKVHRDGSHEKLIDDEEDLKQKSLFKHEVQTINGKKKIQAIYQNSYEITKGKEEVYEDSEGKVVIKLRQNDIKMKLRPIDPLDSQVIPTNKLIEVEHFIEEPLDFFPWAISLSLKRYCFITKNFFELIKPKRTRSRKNVDVYKYMFFCDFINFFVLLFGFSEFSVILFLYFHQIIFKNFHIISRFSHRLQQI